MKLWVLFPVTLQMHGQYINNSQIALSNWVKFNWTLQGRIRACWLCHLFRCSNGDTLCFSAHAGKPQTWCFLMTGILAHLDWFGEKDRAEQVDISHRKNWKSNWSPQDTADISLKFPPRLSEGFGIKFRMKTFTNSARHSQSPVYVSDLLLFQSFAGFLSLEQFLVYGTIYGKQRNKESDQPIHVWWLDLLLNLNWSWTLCIKNILS